MRNHLMAAAKVELAQFKMGLVSPVDIDPTEALLWTVRLAAGAVQWLQEKMEEEHEAKGDRSLYRDVYASSEEGGREYRQTLPSIWWRLYNEERDRLARTCKMALDAGVAERAVRVAEQQGQLLAQAIQGILNELRMALRAQVDDEAVIDVVWHDAVPGIVRRQLLALPALEAGGS